METEFWERDIELISRADLSAMQLANLKKTLKHSELEILLRIKSAFGEETQQTHGVARENVADSCSESLHEPDLAFRVARGARDDECAETLHAVMETESAGEEAVAHDVLEDVRAARARHEGGTGGHVRPEIKVVLSMENHCRSSGRSGRGMQTDDVLHRIPKTILYFWIPAHTVTFLLPGRLACRCVLGRRC